MVEKRGQNVHPDQYQQEVTDILVDLQQLALQRMILTDNGRQRRRRCATRNMDVPKQPGQMGERIQAISPCCRRNWADEGA